MAAIVLQSLFPALSPACASPAPEIPAPDFEGRTAEGALWIPVISSASGHQGHVTGKEARAIA